jgi:hypothetical protein
MATLSYQEKSIWASLLVLTGASAYFFVSVFDGYVSGAPLTVAQIAPPLLSMIVLIVAAEVVLHTTLALCGQEEPKDERDVLVAAKAARNAYYLLITGLAVLGGHAAAAEVFAYGRMPGVEAAVLAIVFAVTIAEIGHYASQLYYYRRGA